MRTEDQPTSRERKRVVSGIEAVVMLERRLGSLFDDGASDDFEGGRTETRGASGWAVGAAVTGNRTAVFSNEKTLPDLRSHLRMAASMRLPMVFHHVSGRGHEAYTGASEAGIFQFFASGVQEAADFTIIARILAEASLTPVLCAQDAARTAHALQTVDMPEDVVLRTLAGRPADRMRPNSAAQQMAFGAERPRVPALIDVHRPLGVGGSLDADAAYQAGVAEEAFFAATMAQEADDAFAAFAGATGRSYSRVFTYGLDDAEYVVIAQGPVVKELCRAVDEMRRERGIRAGVLGINVFRPFPYPLLSAYLSGRSALTVLECAYQPADMRPMLREVRLANASAARPAERVLSGIYGSGPAHPSLDDLCAVVEHMTGAGAASEYYVGARFEQANVRLPLLERQQQMTRRAYPAIFKKMLSAALPGKRPSAIGSRVLQIRTTRRDDATLAGSIIARTLFNGVSTHVSGWPSDDPGNPRSAGVFTIVAHPSSEAIPETASVILVETPAFLLSQTCRDAVQEDGVVIVDTDLEPVDLWAAFPTNVGIWMRDTGVRLVTLDTSAIGPEISTEKIYTPVLRRFAAVGALLRFGVSDTRPSVIAGDDEPAPPDAVLTAFKAAVSEDFGANPELVEQAVAAMRLGWNRATISDIASLPGDQRPATEASAPPEVHHAQTRDETLFDLTRFWKTTGYQTRAGERNGLLADPYLAVPAMPARSSTSKGTGLLHSLLPVLDPATADGSPALWAYCPESAIVAAVHGVDTVLAGAISACKSAGHSFVQLPRVAQHLARQMHRVISADDLGRFGSWSDVLNQAASELLEKMDPPEAQREILLEEIARVRDVAPDLPAIRTELFFGAAERRHKGTGGVFTWAVDPDLCNSCGLCAAAARNGALRMERKTEENVTRAALDVSFVRTLPAVSADRLADAALDDESQANLYQLLHGNAARARLGGGDTVPGDGASLAMRLVFAAVDVHVRPKADTLAATLREMGDLLEQEMQRKLNEAVRVNDLEAFRSRLRDLDGSQLDAEAIGRIVDSEDGRGMLRREEVDALSESLAVVRELASAYDSEAEHVGTGDGVHVAAVLASGPTYPANPYPFPWICSNGQDVPYVASGVLNGVTRRMATIFSAVRRARRLLSGDQIASGAGDNADLDPTVFTPEERSVCPPVIVVTHAYDDAVRRLLAHNEPLNVVLIDDGAGPGDDDPALVFLADHKAFVAQCSIGYPNHLMQCVIDALSFEGPSLIRVYAPHPERHAIQPADVVEQARSAAHSRAVPLFTYDPSRGEEISTRLDLSASPGSTDDWARVHDDGEPFTYADWAAREGRFYHHFRTIPRPAWTPDYIPVSEYMSLADDASTARPFVEVKGVGGTVLRKEVLAPVVNEMRRRLDTWRTLQELAGVRSALAGRFRREAETAIATAQERLESELAAAIENRAAQDEAERMNAVHRRLTARLVELSGVQTGGDT